MEKQEIDRKIIQQNRRNLLEWRNSLSKPGDNNLRDYQLCLKILHGVNRDISRIIDPKIKAINSEFRENDYNSLDVEFEEIETEQMSEFSDLSEIDIEEVITFLLNTKGEYYVLRALDCIPWKNISLKPRLRKAIQEKNFEKFCELIGNEYDNKKFRYFIEWANLNKTVQQLSVAIEESSLILNDTPIFNDVIENLSTVIPNQNEVFRKDILGLDIPVEMKQKIIQRYEDYQQEQKENSESIDIPKLINHEESVLYQNLVIFTNNKIIFSNQEIDELMSILSLPVHKEVYENLFVRGKHGLDIFSDVSGINCTNNLSGEQNDDTIAVNIKRVGRKKGCWIKNGDKDLLEKWSFRIKNNIWPGLFDQVCRFELKMIVKNPENAKLCIAASILYYSANAIGLAEDYFFDQEKEPGKNDPGAKTSFLETLKNAGINVSRTSLELYMKMMEYYSDYEEGKRSINFNASRFHSTETKDHGRKRGHIDDEEFDWNIIQDSIRRSLLKNNIEKIKQAVESTKSILRNNNR